MTIDTDIW